MYNVCIIFQTDFSNKHEHDHFDTTTSYRERLETDIWLPIYKQKTVNIINTNKFKILTMKKCRFYYYFQDSRKWTHDNNVAKLPI